MNFAEDVLKSSGWGLAFSFVVQTVTYPLDVVKLLQQDPHCQKKNYQVAIALLKNEGPKGFYKGIVPRMVEVSQKQVWSWPMITKLPYFFRTHGCSDVQQQALTGLSIATVDAFCGTPFDYLKVRIIYNLEKKVSWRAFPANFAKRMSGWTTFLVAQNHFAQKYGIEGHELTFLQSLIVTVHTAFLVSFAAAPFDVLNTSKITGNALNVKSLVSVQFIRRMYRGWPLSFCALLIQIFSSVILIDKLKSRL